MPTECGTVIRKGKSYSQNAEIIDLLLAAGAIVMGKTATAELAYLVHLKQLIHMIILELQADHQVARLLLLHHLWHLYRLDLKLVDQLLDQHLIVVLLVINQVMV